LAHHIVVHRAKLMSDPGLDFRIEAAWLCRLAGGLLIVHG